MHDPLRQPNERHTPDAVPGARDVASDALARVPGPLSSLATADAATRARLVLAMQRSAGNQSVARALLREPVANAPAPAPADTGAAAMLDAFWPEDAWTGARLTAEMLRIVPGLGFVSGVAADVMTAWDDMAAVPTGDPVLFALTEGLLVFRSGLNIVTNGAQSLLELGQTAQWALGLVTVSEGVGTISVPVVGPVTVPSMIVSGLGALGALAVNEGIGAILAGTSGTLAAIDFVIMLDAGIWATIGPIQDRDAWAKLGLNYLANTMADALTMLVAVGGAGSLNAIPSGAIAQAIDTLNALLKHAQAPRRAINGLLTAFWNVRGGDVLENVPRPAPGKEPGLEPREPQPGAGPEVGFGSQSVARTPADDAEWRVTLAAMRGCFERGDAVLGAAQSDWAQLVDAGASLAPGGDGGVEAVEALREQLPAIAGELESRLAVAEDVAGRLGGGLEAVEAFQGQLDAVVAAVGEASLALDELADDAAGAALRTFLEPVASALERARTEAIAPLEELRESTQELHSLLETVAGAAEETIGLYREALERAVAAAAEADSVSELIVALAGESAALAGSADGMDVDATVEDWRALGAEIAAAEAVL